MVECETTPRDQGIIISFHARLFVCKWDNRERRGGGGGGGVEEKKSHG